MLFYVLLKLQCNFITFTCYKLNQDFFFFFGTKKYQNYRKYKTSL